MAEGEHDVRQTVAFEDEHAFLPACHLLRIYRLELRALACHVILHLVARLHDYRTAIAIFLRHDDSSADKGGLYALVLGISSHVELCADDLHHLVARFHKEWALAVFLHFEICFTRETDPSLLLAEVGVISQRGLSIEPHLRAVGQHEVGLLGAWHYLLRWLQGRRGRQIVGKQIAHHEGYSYGCCNKDG